LKALRIGSSCVCLTMLLLCTAHCLNFPSTEPCGMSTTSAAIVCTEHDEVSRARYQIEERFSMASSDNETEFHVPTVSVSVCNLAVLSGDVISDSELQVTRIFAQAGIQTLWLNCSPITDVRNKECYLADSHHLILKILPHAIAQTLRDRLDVLGVALLDEGVGYYAYVFYDRVLQLSRERSLGNSLLGSVIAHEIGHLLLGSSAHSVSGLMSARWGSDEWRRVSEGNMHFDANQARIMRSHLSSVEHRGSTRELLLYTPFLCSVPGGSVTGQQHCCPKHYSANGNGSLSTSRIGKPWNLRASARQLVRQQH
jgi:hypothetical protein